MKKYFPLTSPVPFKDQYEIDSFTQEHALGDVVKSASPPRLGFHVDVHAVKGDEHVLVGERKQRPSVLVGHQMSHDAVSLRRTVY